MGLDGISINQLRTPENSSAEISRQARVGSNQEHKTVDGLSQGQKVDPDKEKDKDEQFFQGFNDDNQEDVDGEDDSEEVVKYDLSDNNKYCLKVDDKSNNILIIDKASEKVITQIDATELSQYVSFLSNSQGSIVNRKF